MARHHRVGGRLAVVAAGLVALWAATGPAYALTPSQCIIDMDHPVAFSDILARSLPYPATPTTGPNACMNVPSDGMVALRLPAAGQAIDDVAAVGDMSGYRWGFVDAQGELAIVPRFKDAGNFHQGRAKAFDGQHWGYIDARGQWVIPPQYDQVGDFKPGGVASVHKGGHWQIIGHDGEPLGVNLGQHVAGVTMGNDTPTSVKVVHKPYYIAPDGQQSANDSSDTSADMSPVKPYGDDGWMIAARKGREGIVDAKSHWVLPPKYTSIVAPYGRGTLGGARRWAHDAVLLQREDGEWKPRQVKDFRRAGGLWVAVQGKNKYIVLNANGKLLAKLDGKAAFRMQRIGNFLVDASGPKTRVMGPWFSGPVTLGSGAAVDQALSDDLAGNLIAIAENGAASYLITDRGRTIKPAWVGDIAGAHAQGHAVWLEDGEGRLLNIVGADGKPQLSTATVKKLADYRVKPLSTTADTGTAGGIIGLVSVDPKCDCDGKGAGFLMADGTLRLHTDWQAVHVLGGTTDASGHRFAFRSADGVGMANAHGGVILPAKYTHIGDFHGDYALVKSAGGVRVVDLSGQLHAVPEGGDIALLGAGLARYGAASGGLVGLFDIKTGARVTPPRFKVIHDFVRDGAVVESQQGTAGVIDTHGQWIIPPDYEAITALNGAIWKVTLAANDTSAETHYALVNIQGKTLIGPTTNLSTSVRKDGRVEVTTTHEGREVVSLFDRRGRLLVDGHGAYFSYVGALVRVETKPTIGYLGADHKWLVRLHPVAGQPLDASGRRLQTTNGRARIVSGKGKIIATLPKAAWYRPGDTGWLLGRAAGDDGQKTLYYDLDGQHQLTVEGFSGSFRNGLALWDPGHDKPVRWIDKQGQPVATGTYEDLGLPAKSGLAVAESGGRYGYIDKAGIYVIPPVYHYVSSFHDGLATVADAHRAMLIDSSGRPVARVAEKCGVRVLYGSDNKRIWPQELPQGCQQ